MKWLTNLIGTDNEKTARIIALVVVALVVLILLNMIFGRGSVIETLTTEKKTATDKLVTLQSTYDQLKEDFRKYKTTASTARSLRTTRTPVLLADGTIDFATTTEDIATSTATSSGTAGSRSSVTASASTVSRTASEMSEFSKKATKPSVKKWMVIGTFNFSTGKGAIGPGFGQDLGLIDISLGVTTAKMAVLAVRF